MCAIFTYNLIIRILEKRRWVTYSLIIKIVLNAVAVSKAIITTVGSVVVKML